MIFVPISISNNHKLVAMLSNRELTSNLTLKTWQNLFITSLVQAIKQNLKKAKDIREYAYISYNQFRKQ